ATSGGLLRRQPGRAAGGGDDRRRAAVPRTGRQRDRPEGRHPADQAAGRPGRRAQPVRRRGAEGRRGRHPLGGAVPRHRRRQPRDRQEPAPASAVLPRRTCRPEPGGPADVTPQESNEVRVEVDGRTLKLSNLDKVLYPRTGTTKGEVLNYYAQVSPAMLPLLANRCATRVRWPNGVEKQSFFEKNIPGGTPSWVRTAEVPTTGSRAPSKNGDVLVFPVVDDLATL